MINRLFSVLLVAAVMLSSIPMFLLEDRGTTNVSGEEVVDGDPEDLMISGLLPDPMEGSSEFVEIYNPTYRDISLNGVGIESRGTVIFRFLNEGSLAAMMSVRIIMGVGEDTVNGSGLMYVRYSNIDRDLIPDEQGAVELVSNNGEVIDALKYSRDGSSTYHISEDIWTGEPAMNGMKGVGLARDTFGMPTRAEHWTTGKTLINEIDLSDDGYVEIYNPGGQVDLSLLSIPGYPELNFQGKLEQDTYLILPATDSFQAGENGFGSTYIHGSPLGTELSREGHIGTRLGDELTDYVRYRREVGDGIDSTTLYQEAISEGMWEDGNDDISYSQDAVIGRNFLSEDTDSPDDLADTGGIHSSGPTPGRRNILTACFLRIDDEGSFIITNHGTVGVDLGNVSVLSMSGDEFDLPDITLPTASELSLVPNSTGTDDLDMTDLSGTYHMEEWEGKADDIGLAMLVISTDGEPIFIDMVTWSPDSSTRGLIGDIVDFAKEEIIEPVKEKGKEIISVLVNGVRRTASWLREKFNSLEDVLEEKVKELLKDGVDIGDHLNLSLAIIKDGWRFTVSASTPEAQLRFPPFPALSLLLSAEGDLYVQKVCDKLTFGGEVTLRAHVGFKEDWEVVEVRLTGGVSLVVNYPDEAGVSDSHCSSVNAEVGFTLNLELYASATQPQLDLGVDFKETWELWKDTIPVGPKGYGCDCEKYPEATTDPDPDDPFKPPGATTGGEDETEETFERGFGVSVKNRCDHDRELNVSTTTDGGSMVFPPSTIVDLESMEEINIPTVIVSGPGAGPASRPGIGPGDGTPGGGGGGGGGGNPPPETGQPGTPPGLTSGKLRKVCVGSAASFDLNITNVGEVLTENVEVKVTDTNDTSFTSSTTFPVRFKEPMTLNYDAPPGWEIMFYHPGIGYVNDIKGLDSMQSRYLKAIVKVPHGTVPGDYQVKVRVGLRYHPAVQDSMDLRLRVIDDLNIIWQDGFETPPGPWITSGDVTFGPPVLGPGMAQEGVSAAVTTLGANYNNDSSYSLLSEEIPITEDRREGLMLSFWHYLDVNGVYDNCTVRVNTEDGSFRLDKFTDDITSWRREVYDLTNVSVGDISVEFIFETDGMYSDPGWFLDNVSLISCGKPSNFSIVRAGELSYNVTNHGSEIERDVDVLLRDYFRKEQTLYSTAFLDEGWTILSGWNRGLTNMEGRREPMLHMGSGSSGSAFVSGISLEHATSALMTMMVRQSYDPEDRLIIEVSSDNRTMTREVNGSVGSGWNRIEMDLEPFSGELISVSFNQTFSGSFDAYPVAVSDLVISQTVAVMEHHDTETIPVIGPDETVTVDFDPYTVDLMGEHLRRGEVLRTCDMDFSDNIDEETYHTSRTAGISVDDIDTLSPGDKVLVEDKYRRSTRIEGEILTDQGNYSMGSGKGTNGWTMLSVPANIFGGECSMVIISEHPGGTFNLTIVDITISGPSPVDLNISAQGDMAGEPVSLSFSTGSDAKPKNVFWEFGDGNMTADRSPLHVYTRTGKVTVTLTVNFERFGTIVAQRELDLGGNLTEIRFKVVNDLSHPIEGALVYLGHVSATTGPDGIAVLSAFESGTINWTVEGPLSFGMVCYREASGSLEVGTTHSVNITLQFTELPLSVRSPSNGILDELNDEIVFHFMGPLDQNRSLDGAVSMRLGGEEWEPIVRINGSEMSVEPNGGLYFSRDVEVTFTGGPEGLSWKNGSSVLCRDVTYNFNWTIPDDMVLFGPYKGHDGWNSLKVVNDNRKLDIYSSDRSGRFLVPRSIAGRYVMLDVPRSNLSVEGRIIIVEGRGLELTDTIDTDRQPKVLDMNLEGRRITVEFSHIMAEGTEEYDIDTDGLYTDYQWDGRNLLINITGGFDESEREKFTVRVLPTARSMWGTSLGEESSIEIDREDLMLEGEMEDDDEENIEPIVLLLLLLVLTILIVAVVLVIRRRQNNAWDEE